MATFKEFINGRKTITFERGEKIPRGFIEDKGDRIIRQYLKRHKR